MVKAYFRGGARNMGWFNGWFGTRWYSMLYGHRDEADASAMALPIIRKAGLKVGDKLLDMGCGRGRHARIFARQGLKVTGIDLSSESVAEAVSTIPEGHFEVFDIREPYAKGYFDAVVCLFTCLGYSNDRRDDQRAVDAAAIALKPRGVFVLDLLNGPWICHHLVPDEVIEVQGVTFRIERSIVDDDIVKRITVVEGNEQFAFEERVHAWGMDEIEEMIFRAGLRLDGLTDASIAFPFDPEASDRIVAWAHKPE